MEFGAAAAVARWTGQGKQVAYCMVTSGEAGIDGMHPDECRTVREAEQVESARIVGVDEVEFLGLPDGDPGVRRAAAARARGRRTPAPAGHRDHRQLHATPGAGRTSTRPTTSPSARRCSTRCGTPATAGSSPSRSTDEASSRGAASARCGRSARRPASTRSTSPTPSTPACGRWRPTGPTSTASAGTNFDPREFLEGFARPPGSRLGRDVRRALRGLPDGLGRLTHPGPAERVEVGHVLLGELEPGEVGVRADPLRLA